MKHPNKSKQFIKPSKPKDQKCRVIRSFCYSDKDGNPVYVGKYLKNEYGFVLDGKRQKVPNKLSLPKEGIELGKALKAIKVL